MTRHPAGRSRRPIRDVGIGRASWLAFSVQTPWGVPQIWGWRSCRKSSADASGLNRTAQVLGLWSHRLELLEPARRVLKFGHHVRRGWESSEIAGDPGAMAEQRRTKGLGLHRGPDDQLAVSLHSRPACRRRRRIVLAPSDLIELQRLRVRDGLGQGKDAVL